MPYEWVSACDGEGWWEEGSARNGVSVVFGESRRGGTCPDVRRLKGRMTSCEGGLTVGLVVWVCFAVGIVDGYFIF